MKTMIKRNYLKENVISTLQVAYKLVQEKNYSVKDCSLKDDFNICTQMSTDVRMSNNGGNYSYYATLMQISPCIFKVVEDWSCDIASIEGYVNFNGYLVMNKEELKNFLSLPI